MLQITTERYVPQVATQRLMWYHILCICSSTCAINRRVALGAPVLLFYTGGGGPIALYISHVHLFHLKQLNYFGCTIERLLGDV